jgi:single-stranded DNA-binding protein
MTGIEAAFAGVVARDAEQRTSKAGKPYVRFGVGVGYGDATEWINVTTFSQSLIEIAAALTKGSKVYIEGQLRVDRWTAQDGAAKVGLSAVAFRLELLNQIGNRRPRQQKRKTAVTANGVYAAELNDEIPF